MYGLTVFKHTNFIAGFFPTRVLWPKIIKLQFTFKSGARVDAAIKTVAGTLCIDAKFPMENFAKKLKAETEKERVERWGREASPMPEDCRLALDSNLATKILIA